jgi:hypothetical protein
MQVHHCLDARINARSQNVAFNHADTSPNIEYDDIQQKFGGGGAEYLS